MKALKIYVAGKVSKDSSFGTHYWRDGFVEKLQNLSGLKLVSLDPAKKLTDQTKPKEAFGADVYMISRSDVIVVYLSDDISVGGSQEILIAKYYKKPVIGLAPLGGRFNHKNKEIFGQIVEDYRHPFVYSTCDVVCDDIQGVAEQLKNLSKFKIKNIDLIKEAADQYQNNNLKSDKYLNKLLNDS